ncbi:MAG: hypothetical protein IPK82_27650 [Polyangiaceae bacterium]|nr:hypothetical protein [Polyangiaceae bacterium]
MSKIRRLLCLLPILATGCIGAPFVTPPVGMSLTYESLSRPLPDGKTSATHFEVGIHPLAFPPSMRDRRFDPAIGYGFFDSENSIIHAPYLELQTFLWRLPLGKSALIRAGTSVKQMLLFDDMGNSAGFGGTSQLFIELSDHVSGNFSGSDTSGGAIGAGAGELSIGLHLQATALRFHDTTIWAAGVGASIRLPASIGFAWVWLK